MRLGRDQALALEDAPDRDPGWSLGEAAGEVVEDGLRTGVQARGGELAAKLEDCLDDGLVDLVGTRGWAVGSGL